MPRRKGAPTSTFVGPSAVPSAPRAADAQPVPIPGANDDLRQGVCDFVNESMAEMQLSVDEKVAALKAVATQTEDNFREIHGLHRQMDELRTKFAELSNDLSRAEAKQALFIQHHNKQMAEFVANFLSATDERYAKKRGRKSKKAGGADAALTVVIPPFNPPPKTPVVSPAEADESDDDDDSVRTNESDGEDGDGGDTANYQSLEDE